MSYDPGYNSAKYHAPEKKTYEPDPKPTKKKPKKKRG